MQHPKQHAISKLAVTALASLALLSMSACSGGDAPTNSGQPVVVNADGTTQVDNSQLTLQLASLPIETLSDAEALSLAYMREEEKLAHDVYMTLDGAWGAQVKTFANIANSEQSHTDAVKQLLTRYDLTDPAEGLALGVFANATLQQLYADLVAQGMPSLVAALTVGAQIEELDMVDINAALAQVDNADIRLVYESLLKGSRNHLRSFVSTLAKQGVTYAPVYMNEADYLAIVNSPIER